MMKTAINEASRPSSMWQSRGFRIAAALYAAFMAYHWKAKNRGRDWGLRIIIHLTNAVFLCLLKLRGITTTAYVPPEAQDKLPCIVTVSPHGAFAIGHVFMSMPKLRLEERFAAFRGRAAAASVLFKIPILRELLLTMGIREANKSTIDAMIREGCSIAINTGGIWEQVHTDDQQEQLFLQKNLGFIKLALRHGIPIVPSYAFGEGQLFKTYPHFLRELREWIALNLRIGLPAIWPWPRHGTGHHFILGKPVHTSDIPVPNPTEAQVKDVLERWKAAMYELFEAHAHELLPPEVAKKGLKIFLRGQEEHEAAKPAASRSPPSPRSVRSKL